MQYISKVSYKPEGNIQSKWNNYNNPIKYLPRNDIKKNHYWELTGNGVIPENIIHTPHPQQQKKNHRSFLGFLFFIPLQKIQFSSTHPLPLQNSVDRLWGWDMDIFLELHNILQSGKIEFLSKIPVKNQATVILICWTKSPKFWFQV